jgi:peptidoglycan/LPS O-acetylase OafA/YrhL
MNDARSAAVTDHAIGAIASGAGPSHIPALDGLRGVAILLVLLHHFAFYGDFEPRTTFEKIVSMLLAAGWSGVDLFFVLSGFLITRILYRADRGRHYFRNFYLRRTLRIFPVYYATLALFFIVAPVVSWSIGALPAVLDGPYRTLLSDQGWYWSYLVNIQIALHGWPEINVLAHFWSLAVEEQFYLVWPLVVFCLYRSTLIRLCAILIVLSLAFRVHLAWTGDILAAYVLAPARLDALAIGALLALVACGPGGLAPWRRVATAVAGASAAALFVVAVLRRGLWTEDPLTITLGLTLLASLFGSALVLAVTSPAGSWLARTLTGRPLVAIGRYSYGIYVFHHFIALGMAQLFTVGDLPLVAGSRLPALAIYLLIGGGLSLAVAALSWHAFELRFLRLKERFGYARQALVATRSSA